VTHESITWRHTYRHIRSITSTFDGKLRIKASTQASSSSSLAQQVREPLYGRMTIRIESIPSDIQPILAPQPVRDGVTVVNLVDVSRLLGANEDPTSCGISFINGNDATQRHVLQLETTSAVRKPFEVTGNFVTNTLRYSDSSVYSGSWDRGLPHGMGKRTWPSGASYQGDWLYGMAHGFGRMMVPYEGVADVAALQSMTPAAEQEVAASGVANVVRSSQITLPEGSILCYDGEWRFNARSGRGTLTLITNKESVMYYEGWWFNNLRHGVGLQVDADGRRWAGVWAANSKTKIGSYLNVDEKNLPAAIAALRPGGYGTLMMRFKQRTQAYAYALTNSLTDGLNELNCRLDVRNRLL